MINYFIIIELGTEINDADYLFNLFLLKSDSSKVCIVLTADWLNLSQ